MLSGKQELFARVREYWPISFEICPDQVSRGVVFTAPSLWEIYENIENKLTAQDEWEQLAAWAFHQA